MSDAQTYFNEICRNSTTWSDTDPDLCGCRGGGWWLSQLDTWHKCPNHAPDAPHPECDYGYEDEDEARGARVVPRAVANTDDDIPF